MPRGGLNDGLGVVDRPLGGKVAFSVEAAVGVCCLELKVFWVVVCFDVFLWR